MLTADEIRDLANRGFEDDLRQRCWQALGPPILRASFDACALLDAAVKAGMPCVALFQGAGESGWWLAYGQEVPRRPTPGLAIVEAVALWLASREADDAE